MARKHKILFVAIAIMVAWVAFMLLAPQEVVRMFCYAVTGYSVGLFGIKLGEWLTE